jgi:DnaD/phage-associated family protein
MKFFPGFSSSKDPLTTLPNAFFTDLLPIIDHLGELKVTLYTIWFIEQQEGNFRHINFQHYLSDNDFLNGFGKNQADAIDYIKESLQRACDRGVLLRYRQDNALWEESIYFMNSPSGRASLLALQEGAWSPDDMDAGMIVPMVKRPNIYKVYEANIGPLTPLMAETLQEAEDLFPAQWIEDAIQLAVENNVRRWRYVQAILNSWKERGRDEKDRRDAQEDPRRFLDGEFGEFFKHG